MKSIWFEVLEGCNLCTQIRFHGGMAIHLEHTGQHEGRNAGIRCDLFRGLLCGTFPTLMLGHVADAASLRGCGTHVAACSQSRKIGHLKPRRATNFKPCFRRRRFQRFSRGTRQSLSLSTFRITHHPPLQPAQVDPALRESGGGSKRPTGPAPPQPTTSACSLVPRHRCDHQAKHR